MVVDRYLSPKPLIYMSPDPSLLVTPAILVVAVAASETPILDKRSAPILSLITTAFFCSIKRAVSLSLFVVVVITTSSKEAALAPIGTLTSVTLSVTTVTVISCVS